MADEGRMDTVGAQPDESPKQRVDRELSELLEEIRVVLPGVEILFGFLIVVPFSGGFGEISGFERVLYLASLLTTSAAMALLMAPTTYHRLRFREMDKERMLFTMSRLVIVASVLVLLAIGFAVYLVVESILGGVPAAVIATLNAAWFGWFWFGMPLMRRARENGTS
ncbi:MAG TPA: DUF6328 family protein [Candidatus Limnocylindria bacterium]|nr:DUF6328 family protein [Candidatus Limnocylindria bacterium]